MRLYSKTGTTQSAVATTGNGTAVDVSGMNVAGIQVAGTFTASVDFEGTVDGTNWVAIVADGAGDSTQATTAAAAGIWVAGVAGYNQIRTPVTWTSGTSVTVVVKASTASGAGFAM